MRRRVRPPHHVVDAALAVALTVPAVVGLILDDAQPDRPWWIVGPLAALSTLPLAARRSYPLGVLAVTVAATVALNAAGVSTLGPGVFVAMYTVGAHVERRPASTGATAALAVLAGMLVWRDGLAGLPVVELVLMAAAWLLGKYLRTRRQYLHELEAKAERLEREREERESRAVAEEQARIARELHDVIAHNVSVMVVQAAGGREVFDKSPDRAREALASIEATGRAALIELRRLLGVASVGGPAREPQPGVARLPALVDRLRTTGLSVELEIDGDARPLAPGVDLSVYRVVQEALTNTLKHAAARRASVLVRYGARDVVVEVLDDGSAPAGEALHDGRGLVGMRERVALFDGELEAGARAEGGYRVRARFPLGSES